MIIENTLGISGRWRMRKFRNGKVTYDSGVKDNLITNIGMDAFGTQLLSQYMGRLAVGSGSTTPTETDTNLAAWVATKDNDALSTSFTTTSPYQFTVNGHYEFAAGAAAGVLSELGIAAAGGANPQVRTRALITDDMGNPTTITVLADEQLVVDYQIVIHVNEADVTTVYNVKGVDRNIVMRPARMGTSAAHNVSGQINWSGFLYGVDWRQGGSGLPGPITGEPDGSLVSTSHRSRTNKTYVPGSYYLEQDFHLSLAGAAGSTISGAVGTSCAASYQIAFDPPIPKTGTETTKLTLRMYWARYTP